MKQHFLHLARNSFGYLIANITPAVVGVFTLPLYTRFMTPENYGIAALAVSSAAFIGVFVELGLLSAYQRYYFEFKDDPESLKRFVSTIVWFLGGYGFILSLVVVVFGQPMQAVTPGVPFSPFVQMAIGANFFGIFPRFIQILYQSKQESGKYAFITVFFLMVQVAFTIYFVVLLHQGALGYVKAMLFTNLMSASVALWVLRRYLKPTIKIEHLKTSFRFGLPLLPHMLAGWMLSAADRLILNNITGTVQTGIYSIGVQIGTAMSFVATSVNFAWSPFFFAQMKDKGEAARKDVVPFITYWIFLMCLVFTVFAAFSKEVVFVLAAPQYREAYHIVPLVALGFLFNGFYFTVVNPLFWKGKTFIISLATLTSGFLNVFLNLVLVPPLGMAGAALAGAFSNLYVFLLVAFFSIRAFPLPYEFRRILTTFAVTALCVALALMVPFADIRLSIAAKIAIIVAFPALHLAAGFLNQREKAGIRSLWANRAGQQK